MKWLLNNWGGRLYLVVQIACLAITITCCSSFIVENHKTELDELSGCYSGYRFVQENPSLYGQDKETQDVKLSRATDEIIKRHSKQRQDAILYYAAANLVVPALFAVVFFIANGLPKRKSEN